MRGLRAVLVTPLSGPLARFGRVGASALALWAEWASGSEALGTLVRIEVEVFDAHPSATRAMGVALKTRPDVIFGPYGSGPAVAACRATERVVWNHGGAADRLRWSRFRNVVNLLAPASSYFSGALRAIRTTAPLFATVSLLHSATGFGQEVAAGAVSEARRLGFAVEAMAFAPGHVEDAAQRLPSGDVLLVAGGFEDELAAARLLLARPWLAAAFVGAGVDEVLAALGPAREGLIGPSQWMSRVAPQPLDGPVATWFVDAFRAAEERDPPYPAAAAVAAGVIWGRCVRDAGTLDDTALLATARRLQTVTLFGAFRLDPETGLQCGHEVLTVQWQQGARRVVWPLERAECELITPRA